MTDRRHAVIVAARRTPVVPKNGAFRHLLTDELAAPVFRQVLQDTGLDPSAIDQVVMGNALYGGGNPARMAALRAGLPVDVPALTVDTQCCAGLDAILLAARLVESGAAGCVLAGGMESFSRAPVRMHRPLRPEDQPVPYDRPAFAPPPYGDPDLIMSAAELARERSIPKAAQADYAVESHRKARLRQTPEIRSCELVRIPGAAVDLDPFTRVLRRETALRAPVLAGNPATGVTAATVAVEADAAAAVLVMDQETAWRLGHHRALRIMGGVSRGSDPACPALGPVGAVRALCRDLNLAVETLMRIELMEAFAVQALATVSDLHLDPVRVNPGGGALARGHPIGASGAILLVRLFTDLVAIRPDAAGQRGDAADGPAVAAIAAAGGLSCAIAVKQIST